MNAIDKLHQLGQSIWYDNIERRLLKNGEMENMITLGEIRGVTSNPSIFQNAIANSTDYDSAIQPMAWANWNSEDIFFQLAIEDIQETADLFSPLYDQTEGNDGFVSLEVNPKLAYDAEKTFIQALALWKRVNRKNLMIKIPATQEGLVAIRNAIAAGININVTLIFSLKRYKEVIEAYLSGLEDRLTNNLPIDKIASVASFFVSRVDSKVDTHLDALLKNNKIDQKLYLDLRGKAAIVNSKLAYELFEDIISSERFLRLAENGANVQRPLWASTSTKNPEYYDVIYVEELIGKYSVNTMPPQTLDAFRDHGKAEIRIKNNLEDAKELFSTLNKFGIDIDSITQSLEDEGVKAFAKAFDSLLETIEKRKKIINEQLENLGQEVKNCIENLDSTHVVNRLYEKDPSIWTNDTQSGELIQNRLGWLDAPFMAKKLIPEINQFRDEVINEGFTHALLLGMGGSSLAVEVMSLSFRGIVDGLQLSILDSTDPRQVKYAEERNPIGKTLFIVSSKSGGTTEVQAFLKYFYQVMKDFAGIDAGKYFIAITDPDTELSRQAKELNFRRIFYATANVGGRFSALTAFGLVPAGLIGVELDTIIQKTIEFARQCRPGIPAGRNPGLVLGAILAVSAQKGIDKLTIFAEEPFRSFGSWMEQLIAESSGKEGKGIIPIDIEPFDDGDNYSKDRLFVYVKNDGLFQTKINHLIENEHPLVSFELRDAYELGAEFFRWEFATAIACGVLGVNAFDQPDVQDNKSRTKLKISEFLKTGRFNFGEPIVKLDHATVYSNQNDKVVSGRPLKDVIDKFISDVKSGDFIAINAYLPRLYTTEKDLQEFRHFVLQKTGKATTLGFGPRFLHSTGQLHKGGPDKGLFIQISDNSNEDFDIPGFGLSFKNLLLSQASGDYETLVNRNRNVLWIQLNGAGISDLWK